VRSVDNRVLSKEAEVRESMHWQDLHERFVDHQTFVVHSVESIHPPVAKLRDQLQSMFAARVAFNMYFSPPGSVGLPPHWDMTGVFVVQVRWQQTRPPLLTESLMSASVVHVAGYRRKAVVCVRCPRCMVP